MCAALLGSIGGFPTIENESKVEKAVDQIEGLSPRKKKQFKDYLKKIKTLKILVMGKTGVGKSSLLNYVFGSSLFEEGRSKSEPKTTLVTNKKMRSNYGITIVAWDSPGLQDGKGDDQSYLQDMKKKCFSKGKIDLILYCISMKEPRSDLHCHTSAIEKFTNFFGQHMWKNSLFVLTCANLFVDDLEDQSPGNISHIEAEFSQRIQEWKIDIGKNLKLYGVDEDVVDSIRIVPAGHPSGLTLPGCDNWISKVWSEALLASKRSGKCAMLLMELERGFASEDLKFDSAENRKIVFNDDVKHAIEKVVTTGSKVGVFTTVGTGIGAAIGGVAFGVPTLGAGAVGGAVIGGLIGGSFGAGLWALVHAFNDEESKD